MDSKPTLLDKTAKVTRLCVNKVRDSFSVRAQSDAIMQDYKDGLDLLNINSHSEQADAKAKADAAACAAAKYAMVSSEASEAIKSDDTRPQVITYEDVTSDSVPSSDKPSTDSTTGTDYVDAIVATSDSCEPASSATNDSTTVSEQAASMTAAEHSETTCAADQVEAPAVVDPKAAEVAELQGGEAFDEDLAERLSHEAMAAAACAVMAATSKAKTIEECKSQARGQNKPVEQAAVAEQAQAIELEQAEAAEHLATIAKSDKPCECAPEVVLDESESNESLLNAVASALQTRGEAIAEASSKSESGRNVQVCYFSNPDDAVRMVMEYTRSSDLNKTEIEVPPEQYDTIMDRLKSRIDLSRYGNVECAPIKDPYELLHNVQRGELSFVQARNLASAGNLQSIHYDFKTNGVSCSCALGLSFAVSMAIALWSGQSVKQAFVCSLKGSAGSFLSSLLVSIASAQTLRVSAARISTTSVNDMVGAIYGNGIAKEAIDNLALFSFGRSMSSVGAINQVSAMLRTNIVAGAVTTAVLTAPDSYRAAVQRSISWQQLAKNFAVNTSSVAGGTVGWVAGAAAGAGIGSAIPLIGTAIGGVTGAFAGAMAVGGAAGRLARKAINRFSPDDSQVMLKLCEEVGYHLCDDYMLSDVEAQVLLDGMSSDINQKWLRHMYASARNNEMRKEWAYHKLEHIAQEIALSRRNIVLPDDSVLYNMASEVLNEELDQGALKDTPETLRQSILKRSA